ncbi:MAG: hypothetical protein KAJ97_08455 [Acidobacteria bacterium]|nr:hypothetical protein [Acidobacteriota bacterium]
MSDKIRERVDQLNGTVLEGKIHDECFFYTSQLRHKSNSDVGLDGT